MEKISLNQETLPTFKHPKSMFISHLLVTIIVAVSVEVFISTIAEKQVSRYSSNVPTIALILISQKFWQVLKEPR